MIRRARQFENAYTNANVVLCGTSGSWYRVEHARLVVYGVLQWRFTREALERDVPAERDNVRGPELAARVWFCGRQRRR